MSATESISTDKYMAGDYKSDLKPIWCPGCGDFGVVTAVTRALAAIGRPPHEIAFISGIGCSSRIPGYTTAYGFNTVHGRALPIAQAIAGWARLELVEGWRSWFRKSEHATQRSASSSSAPSGSETKAEFEAGKPELV